MLMLETLRSEVIRVFLGSAEGQGGTEPGTQNPSAFQSFKILELKSSICQSNKCFIAVMVASVRGCIGGTIRKAVVDPEKFDVHREDASDLPALAQSV